MSAPDHRQAYQLLQRGDVDGALRFTAALLAQPLPSAGAYAARAAVLKAAGRPQEALTVNREAVQRYPTSGVTWHNLASTLGDLGQGKEAVAVAQRAIGMGLAAPETRLVLARALQLEQRFDEAEAVFGEALALRPDYEEAANELAQLVWMRTGDAERALTPLRRSVAGHPGHAGLAYALAMAQEFTGQKQAARATAEQALARIPGDRRLLSLVVELCCKLGDAQAAVRWAAQAAGDDPVAKALQAQALLALGDGDGAAKAAEVAVRQQPTDQYSIALLATAWRMSGDARYSGLYDYDSLVAAYDIVDPDTADGAAFLEELRGSLRRLHRYTTHPFGQSVRQGSQATLRLDGGHEPAIERLLDLLRDAVARRVAEVGAGDDMFRRRATGAADFSGAWSIRLMGAEGHHADHIHPMGWISSAFYVSVPDDVADEQARPGWIKFGEPGVATAQPMAAERFVQPRAGRLVLFPSYMWHGTVPYASAAERMTVAFDAVPRLG
ncbi:tetratricopeptide repeat protein [Phenylobacterium sp. J426]|uniref:putative 2OG-Fe(II) oxygenase n=1 Tax=Phenylobacterium sp. J426 TaxID=2898439 RepID=UPI0021510988|nr:putative 2OG-Fe(II) oxygenase [Phenylobacterium sp. J426]MCR5872987.1 tetratricopeptide repeat protein [Phenylobacterium sp. J426]